MGLKFTTKANGFLIERPELDCFPWVLGVQGPPRAMGFQQGVLLADKIKETGSGFLSPIFAQFGGWQPEKGAAPTLDQMNAGRQVLAGVYEAYFKPALEAQAPDLLEELNGIADGLEAEGAGIPREDIFIGNFIPEITESRFFMPDGASGNAVEPKGCSDCIVFGGATETGSLIHGTNYDYATFNILHKGMGMIAAKPDKGRPFLAQCLAGTVGFYRGMNDCGMTLGETTSESTDRDIKTHPKITHAMHMRLLIQFSTSAREAVDMIEIYKGTTGYNHSVGDHKGGTAVDIEASCTQVGVVHPRPGFDALCIANHFSGYPGFNGHEGATLATGQLAYWGRSWDEADTIDKWKALVREETDSRSFSWQRYETMEKMVQEKYGRIGVDEMIGILSAWPLARRPEFLGELPSNCEQLYGIEAPIRDFKLASVFSAVFDPENMTAWVAAGGEPAQAGSYWPINLNDYLAVMDNGMDVSKVPEISKTDGKPGTYSSKG